MAAKTSFGKVQTNIAERVKLFMVFSVSL